MEKFYKITKDQANTIGRFEYAPYQMLDPFVGEQEDGTYLISEAVYELLKNRDEIKKIDFSKCELIEKDKLKTKEKL